MNKFILFIFLFFILGISFVSAHCPLCAGAVGAAAVGASYLGIDNSIVGLFVGAFSISTGLWFAKKMKRKYFKFQSFSIVLSSFLFTVIPSAKIVNDLDYISLFNNIYFLDKILMGSIIGGLITLLALYLHEKIKQVNGKVLVPYQGVFLTLILLIISSIPMYFVFK